jgi:3-methyladenine DNA glycosylase Tag
MDSKAPPQRRPTTLAGYLEALSRPVFQAGISWQVVDSKWKGIREAFKGFDPRSVAEYDRGDVDRLLADPKVVRSRAKIEATIDNAQAMLELDAEYGTFRRYLRSHADFERTVADLKRQFRYIGDIGAYFFLWSVKEPTPPHNEWFTKRPTRTSRQRRPTEAATRRIASTTR